MQYGHIDLSYTRSIAPRPGITQVTNRTGGSCSSPPLPSSSSLSLSSHALLPLLNGTAFPLFIALPAWPSICFLNSVSKSAALTVGHHPNFMKAHCTTPIPPFSMDFFCCLGLCIESGPLCCPDSLTSLQSILSCLLALLVFYWVGII